MPKLYPAGRKKPIQELEKLYGDSFDIDSVNARIAKREVNKKKRATAKQAAQDKMIANATVKANVIRKKRVAVAAKKKAAAAVKARRNKKRRKPGDPISVTSKDVRKHI